MRTNAYASFVSPHIWKKLSLLVVLVESDDQGKGTFNLRGVSQSLRYCVPEA